MKKILTIVVLALVYTVAQAQIVSSTSKMVTHTQTYAKRDIVWLDASVGYGGYDSWGEYDMGSGVGLFASVGMHLNWMFSQSIGWDIIKVDLGYGAGKVILADIMTGIRVETPVLFSNTRVYANSAVGFELHWEGTPIWDLGAGLKINNRVNLGLFLHESFDYAEFYSYLFGFRMGFAL